MNANDEAVGALVEIGGALVDIAASLEKPKDEFAEKAASAALVKALVEGLRGLKINAPAVTIQAPVTQDWTTLTIKVGKSSFDGSKEYTISKK